MVLPILVVIIFAVVTITITCLEADLFIGLIGGFMSAFIAGIVLLGIAGLCQGIFGV